MMLFLVFYIFSIVLILECNNWFLIWIGLEINMMSFIALIYKRSSISVEACMKYFFIQTLGSGFLMMMFYAEINWFDSMVLLMLSYKLGAGPFYYWFPSFCESLSWGNCFLMMTFQKVLPLLLMSLLVSMFLWMIILVSILVGALGSMNQNKMKRLMAYSSVHHMGWILVGNFLNEMVWIIYLLLYSMMIIGIFYSLMKDNILEIYMLRKISSKWGFILGMLNMGGMPPMLGFYMKWWIFLNLMWVDKVMMIFMIVMSVLMFYVYFRIVYMMVMSSFMMMGWSYYLNNKMLISMEVIYILGFNIGLVMMLMI